MVQGASAAETQRVSTVPSVIAWTAIVAGIVLRIIEFMRDRPLWLDESMLGLNIASRSFIDLAGPLDYDQSAPLFYLWFERIAVLVGGVSERSLRALPFIAGLALVPAVWIVGRRLAGAAAGAIATVLVALSLTLLSFSAEAKQYGVDAFATVVVVWLTTNVVAAPRDRRSWQRLVIGGVGCLLFSQPAVFVLGGVFLALAADRRVRLEPESKRWLVVGGAIWAVTFVSLYVLLYRATAQSPYMRHFWEGTFLDPRAADFVRRLGLFDIAAFTAPTLTATSLGPPGLLATGWVGGVWTLWHRSRFAALVVAAPLVAGAVATALGLYGVMDRLFLFAAPLTLIAYASLVARLVDLVPPPRRTVAFAAVCSALVLVASSTHVRRIAQPVFFGVGKHVVADVDSMSREDAVYVAARSFPLWLYYTTDWNAPDMDRLRWGASIAGAGAPAHNNAPSRGRVSRGEAEFLRRHYRGRVEIVGLPTGRQYLTSTRTLSSSLTPAELALPAQVDSGWSEIEVGRMASVARPRLWLFGSHMFALDGAEPGLVAELQRRGVRLIMERRQGSTVAYHVEFPGEP